jgi:co-chaperonin GroES (HSP10)
MSVAYLMMEFNCLVQPDEVQKVTKGGILLAPGTKDVEQHAATLGTLVAVSALAFTYADWPADARKPQVGDRVLIAKYGGSYVDPNKPDGLKVVKDKDILAVITDETPGPGYNHESDWPGTRK